MGEKRDIARAGEFLIIYVDTSPSRKWNMTPYVLRCGLCVDFLPKDTEWDGRRKNSSVVEKTGKHHLGQVIVISIRDRSCRQHVMRGPYLWELGI